MADRPNLDFRVNGSEKTHWGEVARLTKQRPDFIIVFVLVKLIIGISFEEAVHRGVIQAINDFLDRLLSGFRKDQAC